MDVCLGYESSRLRGHVHTTFAKLSGFFNPPPPPLVTVTLTTAVCFWGTPSPSQCGHHMYLHAPLLYVQGRPSLTARLPDGDSQILRLSVFGTSGLKDYGSATLHSKIISPPFLRLRPPPSTLAQSKERMGSNFAIGQL